MQNLHASSVIVLTDYQKKSMSFLQIFNNQSFHISSPSDFSRPSVLDFPTVAVSILKLFKEAVEFVTTGTFPAFQNAGFRQCDSSG